jgi:hypothetical protein
MKKKFLDNPAATEKNSAVIKQLTPAILLEITDRRSMVNRIILMGLYIYLYTYQI